MFCPNCSKPLQPMPQESDSKEAGICDTCGAEYRRKDKPSRIEVHYLDRGEKAPVGFPIVQVIAQYVRGEHPLNNAIAILQSLGCPKWVISQFKDWAMSEKLTKGAAAGAKT